MTNHTPAYQIDGASSTRAAFYATACDPSQSIVVEACAGAGKTWMLVSRILRALLEGAEPSQILAITFTRKAAGEMRARLNEWLAEFATPNSSHEQRTQALVQRGLDPARAGQLAPALGGLYERVLASGRAVQVKTFHAWFSQLMRMAPLDVLAQMGLQPGMALMEDVEELRLELFRRFQRRVAAEPELRSGYMALVAGQGRHTLMRWLDAAWSKRVEIERADAAGCLEDAIPAAASRYADCVGLPHPLALLATPRFVDAADAAARELGASASKTSQKVADGLRAALTLIAQGALVDGFDRAMSALHTDKGTLRKLPGEPACAAALSEDLLAIGERVKQQNAHDDHRRMCALSRVLLAEFAALKRARAVVDMSDLENLALKLLGDSTWSGWIQERLDAQLKHLLIDEFQDTSPLQWHALQPWLAAYAGAGGGASGQAPLSVFIVGDPKQSIYRFRRAEPRVFAAAGDFVVGALAGRRLACDHTRRNTPEVLEALNVVFEQAQAVGDYEGFRHHTTEVATAAPGLMTLPRVPKQARAARGAGQADADVWRDSLTQARSTEQERRSVQEAREVARAIAELLARGQTRAGEIQVLARKRSVLSLLSDALRAWHVPHVRPDDVSLADEPEARDLIALIDALASPGHELSLAQALKSPVFGASDDDLLQLAQRARAAGGWWQAMQQWGAQGEASPAVRRAASMLTTWAEAARALPPHDLLDQVLHQGDVVARMLQASPPERREHARTVIHKLLAQTLALDGGRYTTPYGFVRALRARAVKAGTTADANAVQLLTVHGAKGLESDVVFLMDCDPEARNPETGSLLVDWPVALSHPSCVAFVGRQSQLAPSLLPLREQEALLEAREELNALYVAATRARRQLVLSSIEPHRKASDPAWWDRLAPLARRWTPADVQRTAAGGADEILVDDWGAVAAAHPRAERGAAGGVGVSDVWVAAAKEGSRIALVGEAFHRLMQWACAPGCLAANGKAQAWVADATTAAAAEFGLHASEAALAAQAATAVLASPAFAPFRGGPGLLWAGDEVPVSEAGEVLRIDRLVACDEAGQRVWWVLDYKLEHQPQQQPEYLAQMARYRRAVAALQPGEQVRSALVTGLGDVIEVE